MGHIMKISPCDARRIRAQYMFVFVHHRLDIDAFQYIGVDHFRKQRVQVLHQIAIDHGTSASQYIHQ